MSNKYCGIEGNIIEDVFGMTEEEAIEILMDTEYADMLKVPEHEPTLVEKILIEYYKHLVFEMGFSPEDACNLMDVKAVTDKVIITGRECHSLAYEKNEVIENDKLTEQFCCNLKVAPSLNMYKVVAMLLFLEENGYVPVKQIKVCEALQKFVKKSSAKDNEYEVETINNEKCERLCEYYDGLSYEERSLIDCYLGGEDTGHLIMKRIGGFFNLVAMKKRLSLGMMEILK